MNTFKQAFTDLQAASLLQKQANKQKQQNNKQTNKTKSWTTAKNSFLVSKCSWSSPNRSVLMFLSFASILLIVLILILL